MTKKVYEMEKFVWEVQMNMNRIDYKSSLHLDIVLIVILIMLITFNVVCMIRFDEVLSDVIQTVIMIANITNLIFSVRRRITAHRLFKESERVYRDRLSELDELIGECVVCDR